MGCGGCPGGQTEASAPTECNKKCGGAGRCGERIERRRRRMKRDERVAAVKILSVRRKAARKFWAPQQDHRPLRVHNKRCGVKRNPPVTASPCQPPLGKGAYKDGGTDCHSQCAHWLRNDMVFCKGCGVRRHTWVPPYIILFCRAGPVCPAVGAVRYRRRGEGTPPYGSVSRGAGNGIYCSFCFNS